ncbi:CPBP family intramembrane glutamic endopeptidase [Granulicoccus sp. GXG6511]|uniref:CPBP family intramembrane glutamic endopeptidase n=1 Tax=Granulicoccus sp. GXG6511 TaxID=3381351 RepID=UPI003D7E84E2
MTLTQETSADARSGDRQKHTGWALGLPVLRIVLVAAASGLTWSLVRAVAPGVAFPPPAVLASVAMLPVNIVCLLLVARLLHRDGMTVRAVLGLQRGRLLRDALWGLLWIVVLYLPFVGTIMLVMFALHGGETFERFEVVFFDPAAVPDLPAMVWLVIGIVAVLTFAPLNAPAEELVYRGFSQGRLARVWPPILALLVPAVLFGLQHLLYAPTPEAALVFAAAFFVWGLGSGVIYLRQRRLMPLVFAHGLVNLLFTLPALAIPFLQPLNGA